MYYCLNAKVIILPLEESKNTLSYIQPSGVIIYRQNLTQISTRLVVYIMNFTTGKRKKKNSTLIIFRPLWNSLYQTERNSLICSETDVRKSNIACEYIIWIKYLLSNNVRKG